MDRSSKYGTYSGNSKEKMTPNEMHSIPLNSTLRLGAYETVYRLEDSTSLIHLCISSMKGSDQMRLAEMCKELGISSSKTWSPRSTHLVMAQTTVTLKLLRALIEEKPIISLSWVEALKQCPVYPFSLPNPLEHIPNISPDSPSHLQAFITEINAPKNQLSLEQRRQRSVLCSGKTFLSFVELDQCQQLISATGGRFEKLDSAVLGSGTGMEGIVNRVAQNSENICLLDLNAADLGKNTNISRIAFVNLKKQFEENGLRLVSQENLTTAILHCNWFYCDSRMDRSGLSKSLSRQSTLGMTAPILRNASTPVASKSKILDARRVSTASSPGVLPSPLGLSLPKQAFAVPEVPKPSTEPTLNRVPSSSKQHISDSTPINQLTAKGEEKRSSTLMLNGFLDEILQKPHMTKPSAPVTPVTEPLPAQNQADRKELQVKSTLKASGTDIFNDFLANTFGAVSMGNKGPVKKPLTPQIESSQPPPRIPTVSTTRIPETPVLERKRIVQETPTSHTRKDTRLATPTPLPVKHDDSFHLDLGDQSHSSGQRQESASFESHPWSNPSSLEGAVASPVHHSPTETFPTTPVRARRSTIVSPQRPQGIISLSPQASRKKSNRSGKVEMATLIKNRHEANQGEHENEPVTPMRQTRSDNALPPLPPTPLVLGPSITKNDVQKLVRHATLTRQHTELVEEQQILSQERRWVALSPRSKRKQSAELVKVEKVSLLKSSKRGLQSNDEPFTEFGVPNFKRFGLSGTDPLAQREKIIRTR